MSLVAANDGIGIGRSGRSPAASFADRLEKLAALRERGVEPFAYRFDPTHTTGEALALFGDEARERAAGSGGRARGRQARHGEEHLPSSGRPGWSYPALPPGERPGRGALSPARPDRPWRLDRRRGGALPHAKRRGDGARGGVGAAEPSRCARCRSGRKRWMRRRGSAASTRASPTVRRATASATSTWRCNPEVRQVFVTRAKVIRAIRDFLDARGFLEVETPVLQPIYGGASARPFVTHHNALDLPLYLRIADELYLKRLDRRRDGAGVRDREGLPQRGDRAASTTPSSRWSSSTRPTSTTKT